MNEKKMLIAEYVSQTECDDLCSPHNISCQCDYCNNFDGCYMMANIRCNGVRYE